MKRTQWPWLAGLLILLTATTGYAVAAPYLTVRAIERAVIDKRSVAIIRRVDFPAIRVSLKQQINTHLAQRAGERVQASRLGRIGLRGSEMAVNATVDASVNPAGLFSLMQGRKAWAWLLEPQPENGDGSTVESAPPRLLVNARYRYESHARFTVTLGDGAGHGTVLVLTRRGLRWRLSDIRLPLGNEDLTPAAAQSSASA